MQPSTEQVQKLVQLNDRLKHARDAARAKHRSLKRNFVLPTPADAEKPTPDELAEAHALDAAAHRAQAELTALLRTLFR